MSKSNTGDTSFLDINLLGREYRIACTPEEQPALLAAVNLVESKMKEITDKTRSSVPERVAVMAALNIAHEFLSRQTSPQALSGADLQGVAGDCKEFAKGVDFSDLQRRIGSMETQLDAILQPREAPPNGLF